MVAYLIGQLVADETGVYQVKKTRVRTYPHTMLPENVINDYRMSLKLTNEYPFIIGAMSQQSKIDINTATRIFNANISIDNLAKYRSIFNGTFTIIGGSYTDSDQLEALLGQNMTVKGKSTKWIVGF